MLKDFKDFIAKGNVLDLAVAVIMGGAFGAIVNSAVNDLIMPFVSVLTGGRDFKEMFYALDGKVYDSLAAAKAAKPVPALFMYGNFISAIVNFVIIAFFIFMVVQAANKMKKPEVAAAATTKDCPFCASAIPIPAVRCPNCTSDLKK